MQSECRRLHFREFGQNADSSGGGWSAEQTDFVPSAAIGRVKGEAAPSAINVEALQQEAFANGRQVGLEEAETRFGRSADAMGRAIEEISRLRESLLKGSSHDMLRLVMTIARQVVETEIRLKPELVLKTVEKALQAAVQADSHRILVNPRDLDLLRENKPLFLAGISGLKNIIVEADPEIAPGGCRLESDLGEVDATIDGQLEEIRRTLLAAMEEG